MFVRPPGAWLGGWTVETVNIDPECRQDDAAEHRRYRCQID